MKSEIIQQLDARILLLDGAMGTMIQQYKLTDRDYKGNRFSDITIELKGCHDILSLTCPDIIADIHRKYLEAGADIITTNTFNANAISLRDYGLEDYSYEINLEAAKIARREADKISAITPSRPRFTAGTVGPTNKTSSMSADIMNPASREVTFSELVEAYKRQIEGLIDGGTDIILIETVFDTLNAKAALYAVDEVAECRGKEIPVMISATMSDSSGRTLSGQTLEAFYTSVSHARLLSVGLNCAFGPSQLLPYAIRLAKIAECRVSCHPNAGLPNALGEYDETPEAFAAKIEEYLKEGCVNIIGGCCGTTPRHIHEISKFIDNYPPREIPERDHTLRLSNLEQLCIAPESNFINIGERTNVAGSAKFARLIREGNFTEAVSIARRQIEAGAQIIDVCMDDSMINGTEAMQTFLNLIASEPEIARVPVMIDSSDWNVIEAGLRACQGKCIVNSISLKEGEESFLSKAKRIRRYGAALVVMLFDEEGQADTYEKKCKVAERSYRLLTQHGFPAEDIIFDPNILTIATGIAEHDSYAADFINALRWIKEHLPHCHLSGGVSNLSFAFRGNNHIREAMHSVFLFHAIAAGLDMAIVNSQMLRVYSEIEPQLLTFIEDLIFMRRPDATERLIEYSTSATNDIVPSTTDETTSETLPVEQRIRRLLLKGISDGLENDLKEAQEQHPSALKIIESVLMPAMDEIGILFGEGKMFLPQVIKSARVLKEAISILAPSMKSTHSPISHGKVLIATVRGDIHDIGKNIVSLVVGCNGYEVTDLGVMAEAKMIADKAERLKPIAIMLSGLITPSLNEMVEVCKELERRDIRIPVIIGGATTSPLHTALKIAPEYSGVVLHAPDASYNSRFLARLRSDDSQLFIEQTKAGQEKLRQDYQNSLSKSAGLLSIEAARNRSIKKTVPSPRPKSTERFISIDFDIAEVEPFINWDSFLSAWGLKKGWTAPMDSPEYTKEASRLISDANNLLARIKQSKQLRLQAVVQIFRAHSENEDIVITSDSTNVRLPMLREQSARKNGECLADALSPCGDYICLFALTAGVGLKEMLEKLRNETNDYTAILAKFLADRLTEAFAEFIHTKVRRELWGYEHTTNEIAVKDILRRKYQGCRIAFGYAAAPDHTLKKEVFDLLDVENHTSMTLTGNAMISPEESICGMIFPSGDYFTIEKIDIRQKQLYAEKRNIPLSDLNKILPFYLTQ